MLLRQKYKKLEVKTLTKFKKKLKEAATKIQAQVRRRNTKENLKKAAETFYDEI